MLVRLPDTGPTLLAVDAIATAAQADAATRRQHRYDLDPDGAARSAKKLESLCRRERVGLVVYGHDPDQWRTLRLAPSCYQ